jgi:hypothetical protein
MLAHALVSTPLPCPTGEPHSHAQAAVLGHALAAMPAHFSVVTLDRAPVATLNRVLVARAGASPVAMPTGPGQRLHAGVLHTGDKFGIHLCILGREAVCNKPVWQITASTNS